MQKSYATSYKATYRAFDRVKKSDATITGAEIAELLNMKYATFTRRRHQLIGYGMPRPIPGGVMVWSRANILAWINGSGAVHALPGSTRDPVELAREALEERMGVRS